MSHSEAPISINLKTPAGTQLTLRANTPDEFTNLTSGIFQILEAINEVETANRNNAPAQPVTMTPQAIAASLGGNIIDTSSATSVPTQEYTQPIAGGRMCGHGKMTAIQGIGKDGKPYKGYFCPAPKGAFDKCKNQYVKVTDLEWNTFVPDTVK